MADRAIGGNSQALLFLTDEQLRKGIEAMFFAYRGFTADPDRILADKEYGRAHHRAIHFIHRCPGTTVNNLLSILGVTKQSLNRVLRTLIEDGLVESRVGRQDKRERHLHLTPAGASTGARIVRCPARPDARRLPRGRAGGGGRLPAGAGGDDGRGHAAALPGAEGWRRMSSEDASPADRR